MEEAITSSGAYRPQFLQAGLHLRDRLLDRLVIHVLRYPNNRLRQSFILLALLLNDRLWVQNTSFLYILLKQRQEG